MTRATLSAANRTEIAKNAQRRADFMELRFPSLTVRSTTADRNVTWGGFNWLADARFVQAAGYAEKSDLKARRTSLLLAGTDAALVTAIMNDKLTFSEVDLYVGFFNENWTLVDTPHAMAKNLLMSAPKLKLGAGTAQIELSLESWSIFSTRDAAVLATPETQRQRYAGDTGMDRIAAIMTKESVWGGAYQLPGARNRDVERIPMQMK